MIKWSCRHTSHLMLAMLASMGILSKTARGQDAVEKSEIVQLNDAQKLFCEQVDQLRASFADISARSPAWTRAEEASQQLAKDPDNPELKRRMISCRAEFMREKMEQLKNVAKSAPQLDQAYSDYCKFLDVEILDAKTNVDQAQQTESQELRFLADSLVQLKQIKAYLPGNATSNGDFTAAEQRKLAEFNTALRQAEFQLESVRASKSLHDHHMAVLAQIKIQAAREYLGIKRKAVQASQDRRTMAGIARNDLTALKILDDEARLAELQRRPPIDYPSDNALVNPAKIEYRFSEVLNTTQDETVSAPLTIDAIDRVEELLKTAPSETSPVNKETEE